MKCTSAFQIVSSNRIAKVYIGNNSNCTACLLVPSRADLAAGMCVLGPEEKPGSSE